jgi:diguanylate cyclase (GGDEF)-like protein
VLSEERRDDWTEHDAATRRRLLRWGSAIAGAAALLGLGYRLLLGDAAPWHSAAVLVLVAGFGAVLPLTGRPGREAAAGTLAVGCAYSLLAVLALDGGVLDAPILTLLPLLPVAAWFLLGGRAGWTVAAAGCLLLVGLSLVQRDAELALDVRVDAELARPSRALWLGATLLLLAGLTRAYERQSLRRGRVLRNQANKDRLTGLENRRGFEAALEVECRRAARSGRPLSLAYFDIDHFKTLNDTYGHDKGDHCLVAVAYAASTCLRRSSDLLARYGGEEFIALCPGTGDEQARKLAEAIRVAVEELEIENRGAPHGSVTISVGTSTSGDDLDPRGLIEQADQALYRAKEGGRNRVEGPP